MTDYLNLLLGTISVEICKFALVKTVQFFILVFFPRY